uniref:Uncharacterized protein n=1 Tax=Arundo donax TaxID=35708 RepID=A0A0A9CRJ0_ARUDO
MWMGLPVPLDAEGGASAWAVAKRLTSSGAREAERLRCIFLAATASRLRTMVSWTSLGTLGQQQALPGRCARCSLKRWMPPPRKCLPQ